MGQLIFLLSDEAKHKVVYVVTEDSMRLEILHLETRDF